MSNCPVHDSNWVLCAKVSLKNGTKIEKKKSFQITIKLFLSERCTSRSSKTETVTYDSKFFKSGMSQ